MCLNWEPRHRRRFLRNIDVLICWAWFNWHESSQAMSEFKHIMYIYSKVQIICYQVFQLNSILPGNRFRLLPIQGLFIEAHSRWHCGTISKFLLYNPSKRRRVWCAGGHIYIICIAHIKLINFIFLALCTLSTFFKFIHIVAIKHQ